MRIGLLSDTHSYLDPQVFEHFKDCDEVWHAGDIGDPAVADQLEKFKPLVAVHGNIDSRDMRTRYPEDCWMTKEGLVIWMTHIAGAPPRYNPRVVKVIREKTPDLLLCGHSHILRIKRDAGYNNMLYLNPGAAGNEGFHPVRTIVRFEIADKEIKKMEAIELGKRGRMAS